MKKIVKNIGLLLLLTFVVTLIQGGLEDYFHRDFDYLAGYIVGALYASIKV